ncbi:EAL domain-containing protein [Aromatoleum sp.]|uniref:EAL domain-containing protein n=1 Tax=Aromatoleum sp. TaxID=2307007 RepID=UPI002FC5C1A4
MSNMFLRPSLGAKFAVAFVIFLSLTITNATVIDGLLNKLHRVADTINVAGRMRMLSQRVAFQALLVLQGRAGAAEVEGAVRDFESGLEALERGGHAFGYDVRPSPPAIVGALRVVRETWVDYEMDIESLLGAGPIRAVPVDLEHMTNDSAILLSNLEAVVAGLTQHANDEEREALTFMRLLVVLDALLLGLALLAVRRSIIVPLRDLSAVSRHFAAGDYSPRLGTAVHGEIGQLAADLNRLAEQTERHMQRIEFDRRQLESRESLLQTIVDTVPDCVALIGADGRLLSINRSGLAMLEAGRAGDVVGKPFLELVPKRHYPALQRLSREISEHDPVALEFELVGLGGTRRWVDTQAVLLPPAGGEEGVIVSVTRDVTERRRSVEHLRVLSRAIEQSPSLVVITDPKGRIEYVNPSVTRITGYAPSEVLGQSPNIFASGNTPGGVYRELWGTLRSGEVWRGELLNRQKNGDLYWEHMVASPIKDSDGQVTHLVAVKENLTERKRAERVLERLNRTLRLMTLCDEALVRIGDESELLRRLCDTITRVGGYRFAWVGYAEQDERKSVRPVACAGYEQGYLATLDIRWDSSVREIGPIGKALRTARPVAVNDIARQHDFANNHEALARDYLACVGLPLCKDGQVLGVLAIYAGEIDAFDDEEVDLLAKLAENLAYGIGSLRTAVQQKSTAETLRLRNWAVESSSNGIAIADLSSLATPILYVNPAFERMTGYSSAETVGRNGRFLLGDDVDQPAVAELEDALRRREETVALLRNYRKDGTLFWNEVSLAPMREPDGDARYCLLVMNDVTERKHYEERLEYQASHDSLTGLPNRNLLINRLRRAIANAQRNRRTAAILFIDLDHFKYVNDSLGHNVGDRLLMAVAERLASCVRDHDTVARLGGDEFVVVLQDVDSEAQVVSAIGRIQGAMVSPYLLEDNELYVSSSIGVSLCPRDGSDVQTLLMNADTALYRAKARGRNNFQFYAAEMNANAGERIALGGKLRRAVENAEFVLHFQPQIDVASQRVVGAEALIRWRHPQLGMVPPGKFIPLAEETGIIVPIGEWVLRAACAQSRAWIDRGLPPVRMAVNLSACQFRQENLPDLVARILEEHGLDPGLLELELTESMLMDDPNSAIDTMHELKAVGLRLSLDDFGTGYSSLNRLKRFPIDALKIDRSFVQDITTDRADAAISCAVISLAHSLGLSVVAEGVERIEQLDFLRGQGCDEMQGFYFSPPLAADAFAALLQQRDAQG